MPGLFKRLEVSLEDIERLAEKRPSFRGILIGYLAEQKLEDMYLKDHKPEVPDDHKRDDKGDRTIVYKDTKIRVEIKSLQTNSVKKSGTGWTGSFQCDASDSSYKDLPNGDNVKTVCLVVGGFDLLAINLFAFGETWRFAFCHNNDLPRSKSKKYTADQQKYLLQTTPPITWPLQPPYEADPLILLDRIVREKASRKQ
jgi:hypothetical protein